MSHVVEFSNANAGGDSIAVPVTAAVPAGRLVVVSFAALTSNGTYSIVDSRGNTYSVDDGTTLFGLSNSYSRQGYAVLTTALQSGDSITLSCSGASPTRWAAVAGVYDDPTTPVAGDVGGAEGSGTTYSVSGMDVVRNGALIVCAHYMNNSGRTVVAGSGWSMGAKVISTAGGGDRAIVQAWRYYDAGSYTITPITYTSSGNGGTVARVFETPVGGGGGGGLAIKERVGGVWTTLTMKERVGGAWTTVNIEEL